MKPILTIVGGGPGDPDLLTGPARAAVRGAERAFAAPRLAETLGGENPRLRAAGVAEIRAALAAERADTVVAVSGDAGFYSLSSLLARDFGETYQIRTVNGLSSLQYFCGRLNRPYDDVKVVSLHGRRASAAGPVSYHRRVFFLTGGENSVRALVEELCALGLGHVSVTVGENLSAPEESLVTGRAEELRGREFSPLAVALVENPRPADPDRRLRDGDFVRGDAPMTKESVRTLSTARLEVAPGDTVWDIGAGTGSVSVALAFAAREGMVWAIERDPDALELIRANRERLGAHNIAPVEAEAPAGLEKLPRPDKVFIGGSGGGLTDTLRYLADTVPRFTLCVNTVTLENLTTALAALDELGFGEIEITCVNVSAARQAGSYRLMTAQNPVHILSARWPG